MSLLIAAAGCQTPAELLDPSFVQQIHAGQNRTDVCKLLGAPNWSRNVPNVGSADTYIYSELVNSSSSSSSSARDLTVRAFSVRYDASRAVQETLLEQSRTPAIIYGGFSMYAGPKVTDQDVSSIRIGVTTRADLEKIFQKPIVVNLHPVKGLELHWYQIAVGASVTHREDEQGLHVLVDEQGVVRNAEFHSTNDRSP
jgi:outer membrane protein assembly factor BamE (lipoprotein component of BamABCDE complex)